MNLNNYDKRIGLIKEPFGNVTQWYWPQGDALTFVLIMRDWVSLIRPFLQEKFTDGKGTVVQAGGHCGAYPLLFTEMFEHVYTFEPDPLSFFCLSMNCQMPHITKINCAVGDDNYSVVMKQTALDNRGMNKAEAIEGPGTPVVAIDSFGFPDVKVIQLDLEGYEPRALRGALKTIEKYHPMLILECADNYDEVYSVIEPLGYKPLAKITKLDTVFTYQP